MWFSSMKDIMKKNKKTREREIQKNKNHFFCLLFFLYFTEICIHEWYSTAFLSVFAWEDNTKDDENEREYKA